MNGFSLEQLTKELTRTIIKSCLWHNINGIRPAEAVRHVCHEKLKGVTAVQTLSRLNRNLPAV